MTHLRTTVPWQFFYLYALLNCVSRKAMAWHLAESLNFPAVLILVDWGLKNEQTLEVPKRLCPRSLSDRGTQMRSRLTRRIFGRPGIEPLYARPLTPNDNPRSRRSSPPSRGGRTTQDGSRASSARGRGTSDSSGGTATSTTSRASDT